MFYAVIWDVDANVGDRSAAAAIRYNKEKETVSFVAKNSLVPVLRKIFNSDVTNGVWATSRTSDEPLKRVARSLEGGEFYPEGQGQEEFMQASMQLEGEDVVTIKRETDNE